MNSIGIFYTPMADAKCKVQGALEHWRQVLIDIDFLNPESPQKLMPRLNQALNRLQVTEEEIHLLRGIAKAVQKHT